MFAKRTLPVLVAFGVGFIMALRYYVPGTASDNLLKETSKWTSIIVAFMLLLAVFSICQQHSGKIRRKVPGWGYSGLLFLALITTVVLGFWCKGVAQTPGEEGPKYGTAFGWIYNSGMVPLAVTMFATLGFYVASAAFRAFRAKTLGAFLLLFFALILLFGKAPLGVMFWDATVGQLWSVLGLDKIVEWIMSYLNMPARRAILIGVALGMIATSLKIILGIERTYLGGKGE
jgi:hypothetical protein